MATAVNAAGSRARSAFLPSTYVERVSGRGDGVGVALDAIDATQPSDDIDATAPPRERRGDGVGVVASGGTHTPSLRLILRRAEGQKDAAKQTGPLHRRAGQALGVAVSR